MSRSADPARAAIIDIGSNSVRLVIYAVQGASALPYFNEKVMAGLGVGLAETGALSQESVADALAALRRFRAIVQGLGVDTIQAVATEAVRRASNGAAFARRAEMVLGVSLNILSGEDEGRLAACGVVAGSHAPRGLVGDLGGSSLELHSVGMDDTPPGETHLLGPLALASADGFCEDAVRAHVAERLETTPHAGVGYECFYAVGGAWRTLAKFHMGLNEYPLRVLNGYAMRAKELRKTIRAAIASVQTPELRTQLEAISRRRAPMTPYAGVVLDELLARTDVERVVISANGLREGVLREMLSSRTSDALHDGAIAYLRLTPDQVAFAEQLYSFVSPALAPEPDLFGSLDADERIDRAACLMSDAGGLFHPDHRASMAFDGVLRAPYAALSHAERCFIAHAVGTRYARSFSLPGRFRDLIDQPQRLRARRLGACMRLGALFSGRSADVLKEAALERTASALVLNVQARSEAMVSRTVQRRLAQAADNFSLQPEIRIV